MPATNGVAKILKALISQNTPYCHHRVIELAKQGLRERVERAEPAPGIPFDHGRFDLLLEPLDGKGESIICAPPEKIGVAVPSAGLEKLYQIKSARQLPTHMRLCRNCNAHSRPDVDDCPRCGANVAAAARSYEERLAAARMAEEQLSRNFEHLKLALSNR